MTAGLANFVAPATTFTDNKGVRGCQGPGTDPAIDCFRCQTAKEPVEFTVGTRRVRYVDSYTEPGEGLHAHRAPDRRGDHRNHRSAPDPQLPGRAPEGQAEADRGRHEERRHRE